MGREIGEAGGCSYKQGMGLKKRASGQSLEQAKGVSYVAIWMEAKKGQCGQGTT